jgi:hypothetical protein
MLAHPRAMSARPSPPPLKKDAPAGGGAGAPPPLKRGASGGKPKKKHARDDDDDAPPQRARDDRDIGDEVEKSGAAMRAPGDEDDATKGDWLFKQNDMVLGPVTAIVLVERIKQGELSADTPIARDGQPFKPMKLVALFREAHEATLERKKREAEERAYNAAVRRARVLRALLLVVMFLGPAGAGAVGGHLLMLKQPWDKTPEWIAKAPPLVDLPPRPPEVKKAEPPPRVDEPRSDDRVDDDGDDKRVARNDDKPDRRVVRKGDKKGDDKKGDKGGDKRGDDKKGEEKAEEGGSDQGFVKELTNEQAVAPLKSPAVKGPLGSCFRAEIEANKDLFADGAQSVVISLAYTITEQGRSANVEIQNRELRGRPVQDCVKKALANARWPRFEGERKNVSVPFSIKKPKSLTGPAGAPK